MPLAERVSEIMTLLSVSRDSVERWTKDARQSEKETVQARAYDLWLDCYSQREIAEIIGSEFPAFADTTQQSVSNWLDKKSAAAENLSPPDSRQHFDIWQFQKADGESSYFGRMPPQVVENLLWLYTEPGSIVFDPVVGGGRS